MVEVILATMVLILQVLRLIIGETIWILEVTVQLISLIAGLCPLFVVSLSLRCRALSSLTLHPTSRKIVDPSHYSFKAGHKGSSRHYFAGL